MHGNIKPNGHNSDPPPAWARYGVAIATVVLGYFGRQLLTPGIGPTALPFIFFFPAVAIAAWYGGGRPGMLAVALSAFAAHWFFSAPIHTFSRSRYDILALVAFLLASLLIVGAIQAMHLARRRLVNEIAERKRAEAELVKAQQTASHLAAVVEHSGDAIVTKNLNGIVQTWNPSAERLFGYRAEEIVGKHVTLLFPPDRLNEEDHIMGRLRHGQPVERLQTIRIAKDGSSIPVSVSVSPLKNPQGEIVGASKIIHDISEIVAAREALEREKELLATTLASIGDAVIITDANGQITFLNAEAERLTKWSHAEAVGQPLPRVFRIVNEETRAVVENPVEKVLRLGQVVGLANHTVLIAKDETETPIDDSAAPIRRSGGPLFGVVLVFRDFTERKNAEEALREAQRKLSLHAAELEATVADRTARLQETVNDLQSFSYSIAHDMRAPLRAMGTFAQLVKDEMPAGAALDTRTYCERIILGAARLDNLIKDALIYTKAALQESPLRPVDLLQLIRGLLETYPNLYAAAADIDVEENLPLVLGNESLLTQCFSNLLGNAVKFVAPGVRPNVRVLSEAKDDFARIWVEDNGIGIPEHAQSRLFGMFEKLDNQYEGTGIGLAIVRKVVERMGGRVGVESAPGRGSRFWVELRVAPRNENR